MKQFFLLAFCLLLSACGTQTRTVKLSQITPQTPYLDMHEQLTVRSDYDTGLFVEVRTYATLLVPEMRQYRNDIPEEGTAVEFNVEGTQEDFIISRMALTVEDSAGNKITVNGLGTINQNNKDVKFIPLESVHGVSEIGVKQQQEGLVPETAVTVKATDTPVAYRHFIIVFPFKITSETKYLGITAMDLLKPQNKVCFRWNFS